MWQPLYDPPFILPSKHAALFRHAAYSLSCMVDDEDDEWPGIGIAIFDDLTHGQKQVAILTVALALLDPAFEPPEVSAVLAATVDAIYIHLQSEVDMEIGHDTTTRQMILEALDEANYWEEASDGPAELVDGEEPQVRPPAENSDRRQWAYFVDDLCQEILDDYDHDMMGHLMDMAPERAAKLKEQLNIDPNFFVTIVEDPTDEQLDQVREEIESLLAGEDANR